MKRLVLPGEGHGEVAALPILVRRLLQEKGAADQLYMDREVIRANPSRLVRWNQPSSRPALPSKVGFPPGEPESHGKRWLEQHSPNYRPTRDQAPLTELVDLACIRAKGLRSFRRLDHALAELLEAVGSGCHVSTPA